MAVKSVALRAASPVMVSSVMSAIEVRVSEASIAALSSLSSAPAVSWLMVTLSALAAEAANVKAVANIVNFFMISVFGIKVILYIRTLVALLP